MAETSSPNRRVRAERPLSPHLQIYRLPLTMLMSGFHRVTGFGLISERCCWPGGCSPPSSGPNAYAKFEWFIGSIIGQLLLLGYTWALIHHMLGGVRHLIWDTGRGLGPQEREWLARATISARCDSL